MTTPSAHLPFADDVLARLLTGALPYEAVSAGDCPALIGRLTEMQERLRLRMVTALAPALPAVDRTLKVKAAAAMLGMSKGYLYDHADDFPFTRREGRAVRFSEQGIQAWLRGEREGRSRVRLRAQRQSRTGTR